MMQNPQLKFYDWKLIVHGFVTVLSFLCVNSLMRAIQPSEFGAVIVYACFATIGASAALLAIWGTLGPETFWHRMLVISSVAFLLLGLWLLGLQASSFTSNRSPITGWRDTVIVLLRVPLYFLSLTALLWLANLILGWRIVLVQSTNESNLFRRITIRDILFVMTMIAIALTLTGRAMVLGTGTDPSTKSRFWNETFMGSLACMGAGLLMITPFVLAILRPKKIAFGITGLVGYLIVFFATLLIFPNITGWPVSLWNIVCGSVTCVAFVATTTLPLMVARQQGFRLRWGNMPVFRFLPAALALCLCALSVHAQEADSSKQSAPTQSKADTKAEKRASSNPVKGHAQYSLRDERRDRHSGRIWRITTKGKPTQEPPNIAEATIPELLELLKRPEYRMRYWSKRELREREQAASDDHLHESPNDRSHRDTEVEEDAAYHKPNS